MEQKISGKAKGGMARAEILSPEERSEIAQKAAIARWGSSNVKDGEIIEALREGVLPIGDIEFDCYVLKDKRRVFHRRGFAKALGMKSEGGNVFLRTINSKGLGSVIPDKLKEKILNPIVFRTLKGDLAHGSEATTLIELCDAIWEARKRKKLTKRQDFLGVQAEIIIRSSAKIGIIALIDEATGYIKDKRKEEYREAFKEFIREEVREWEKEFPEQFYDVIYKLYNLRKTSITKRPKFFGGFTRKYIYAPLANSNGAILEMLDEKNPVVYASGGRKYRMFQFLSEVVGLPALRAHIWQVVGIGNASNNKDSFDRAITRAFPQSGYQGELFDDF